MLLFALYPTINYLFTLRIRPRVSGNKLEFKRPFFALFSFSFLHPDTSETSYLLL